MIFFKWGSNMVKTDQVETLFGAPSYIFKVILLALIREIYVCLYVYKCTHILL